SITEAEFNEPEVLVFSIDEVTNVTCFGANDGTLTVSYSGGTPFYRIGLVDLANVSQTLVSSEVLESPSGTYTFADLPPSPTFGYGVFIEDNQLPPGSSFTGPEEGGGVAFRSSSQNFACRVELPGSWSNEEDFTPIIITQPDALEITSIDESPEGVNCDGSGGEITINIFGGTPPYQYSLSEGGFEDGNVLFPPTATGTAYVQDANGCIASAEYDQTFAPNDLDFTWELTEAPVGCRPGQITVTLSGGDGPYEVELNINEATVLEKVISNGEPVVFDNIDENFYGIVVVDTFSCFAFEFFEIGSEPGLSATTTAKTDESCYESEDGSISIEVAGGVPPYTIV
ncbi:MAG: SprB repeat-containing protein, partial [Bacteroidota bacterium]